MSQTIFSGESATGSISEALGQAILQAKDALETDIILWELSAIRGKSGGFVHINEVTVSISASIPAP